MIVKLIRAWDVVHRNRKLSILITILIFVTTMSVAGQIQIV